MYYDFNFDRDSAFFDQSPTIKFIKEKIEEQKLLKNIKPTLLEAGIKLWAESVIKHNLDINMMGVDYLKLISHQNSQAVLDTIGQVMAKDKSTRTPQDFDVLRSQGSVTNYIEINVFAAADIKKDLCNDLKWEFIQFKNPELQSNIKVKP